MQVLTPPQSYASLLASFARKGTTLFCNAKHCLFIGVYFFVNLQFFKLVLTPLQMALHFP